MAKTIAFLCLSVVLLIPGCAMVGQPPESVSGNSETRLGPDVFRIPAPAPDGDPSPEKSQDMALLRAADFSLQHGYRFFAVISDKDTGSDLSSDSSFDYLTYAPDQASVHSKPDTGLLIQGFADKPAKIFAFDASFLQSSVRQKYGLPEETLDQAAAPAGPAPMKSLYDDDQPSSPTPPAAPEGGQPPANGGMRSLYPDQ